jgi:hypothetical protein
MNGFGSPKKKEGKGGGERIMFSSLDVKIYFYSY